MVRSKAATQRAPRRRLSVESKRGIVELTLRPGASVAAVARDHSISRHTLAQWRERYRLGTLGRAASATLLPVTIMASDQASPATQTRSSRVEVVFRNGMTMRIESPTIDAAMVCALVAQLK
jgi:transposase